MMMMTTTMMTTDNKQQQHKKKAWKDEVAAPSLVDWEEVWTISDAKYQKAPLLIAKKSRRRSLSLIPSFRRLSSVGPTSPVVVLSRRKRRRWVLSVRHIATRSAAWLLKGSDGGASLHASVERELRLLGEAAAAANFELFVSLLRSSATGGVRPADVLPLLAYSCDGAPCRDLANRVGTVVEENHRQRVSNRCLARLVVACDELGVRFRWEDARFDWLDRKYGFATGRVSKRVRSMLHRRVSFLKAVFRRLAEDDKTITLRRAQKGLVALGERVSVKDFVKFLVATGERELENLERVDLLLFLKLAGCHDARMAPAASSCLVRACTTQAKLARLVQVADLFIALDANLAGVVSCDGLAARVRTLAEEAAAPGSETRAFLERAGFAIANSPAADTDVLDFADLVHFVADADNAANYVTTVSFPPARGVPWTPLLDGLSTLDTKARENEFATILRRVPDKHLATKTREGNTILHYIANVGDTAACRMVLRRESMRSRVCDRNRVGLHAAAVCYVRRHAACETVLRAWIGAAVKTKMMRRAATQRQLLSNTGYAGMQRERLARYELGQVELF